MDSNTMQLKYAATRRSREHDGPWLGQNSAQSETPTINNGRAWRPRDSLPRNDMSRLNDCSDESFDCQGSIVPLSQGAGSPPIPIDKMPPGLRDEKSSPSEKEWQGRLLQARSIAAAKEQGLKAQRNQLQLQLELSATREALLDSRLREYETRLAESQSTDFDPRSIGIQGLVSMLKSSRDAEWLSRQAADAERERASAVEVALLRAVAERDSLEAQVVFLQQRLQTAQDSISTQHNGTRPLRSSTTAKSSLSASSSLGDIDNRHGIGGPGIPAHSTPSPTSASPPTKPDASLDTKLGDSGRRTRGGPTILVDYPPSALPPVKGESFPEWIDTSSRPDPPAPESPEAVFGWGAGVARGRGGRFWDPGPGSGASNVMNFGQEKAWTRDGDTTTNPRSAEDGRTPLGMASGPAMGFQAAKSSPPTGHPRGRNAAGGGSHDGLSGNGSPIKPLDSDSSLWSGGGTPDSGSASATVPVGGGAKDESMRSHQPGVTIGPLGTGCVGTETLPSPGQASPGQASPSRCPGASSSSMDASIIEFPPSSHETPEDLVPELEHPGRMQAFTPTNLIPTGSSGGTFGRDRGGTGHRSSATSPRGGISPRGVASPRGSGGMSPRGTTSGGISPRASSGSGGGASPRGGNGSGGGSSDPSEVANVKLWLRMHGRVRDLPRFRDQLALDLAAAAGLEPARVQLREVIQSTQPVTVGGNMSAGGSGTESDGTTVTVVRLALIGDRRRRRPAAAAAVGLWQQLSDPESALRRGIQTRNVFDLAVEAPAEPDSDQARPVRDVRDVVPVRGSTPPANTPEGLHRGAGSAGSTGSSPVESRVTPIVVTSAIVEGTNATGHTRIVEEVAGLGHRAEVTLKLAMEYSTITDFPLFSNQVRGDVANAVGLDVNKVRVDSVRAGSVIVVMQLDGDVGRSGLEVAWELSRQMNDPASRMRRGMHTCRAVDISFRPMPTSPTNAINSNTMGSGGCNFPAGPGLGSGGSIRPEGAEPGKAGWIGIGGTRISTSAHGGNQTDAAVRGVQGSGAASSWSEQGGAIAPTGAWWRGGSSGADDDGQSECVSENEQATAAGTLTYTFNDDDTALSLSDSEGGGGCIVDDDGPLRDEDYGSSAAAAAAAAGVPILPRAVSPPTSRGQMLCPLPEARPVTDFPSSPHGGFDDGWPWGVARSVGGEGGFGNGTQSCLADDESDEDDDKTPLIIDVPSGTTPAPASTDSLVRGQPTGAWARAGPSGPPAAGLRPVHPADNPISPFPSGSSLQGAWSGWGAPQWVTPELSPNKRSDSLGRPMERPSGPLRTPSDASGLGSGGGAALSPVAPIVLQLRAHQQVASPQLLPLGGQAIDMSPFPSSQSLKGFGGGTGADGGWRLPVPGRLPSDSPTRSSIPARLQTGAEMSPFPGAGSPAGGRSDSPTAGWGGAAMAAGYILETSASPVLREVASALAVDPLARHDPDSRRAVAAVIADSRRGRLAALDSGPGIYPEGLNGGGNGRPGRPVRSPAPEASPSQSPPMRRPPDWPAGPSAPQNGEGYLASPKPAAGGRTGQTGARRTESNTNAPDAAAVIPTTAQRGLIGTEEERSRDGSVDTPRSLTFNPQSAADLVGLLASHQTDTSIQALMELDKSMKVKGGKEALLELPLAVPSIYRLLSPPECDAARLSLRLLTALSMEPSGRQVISATSGEMDESLCLPSKCLAHGDRETKQCAALLFGNLMLDRDGRDRVLQSATIVDGLVALLWEDDIKTVRYAAGALRNVSAEQTGKDSVLKEGYVHDRLTELRSHHDVNTARYASSVLKNLHSATRSKGSYR